MAQTAASKDLTAYFVYLLLTATLGPLLFGYHLAELNAPELVIRCQTTDVSTSVFNHVKSIVASQLNRPTVSTTDGSPLPQCLYMNPIQFGLVSSFFTLGGLFGALAAGPISGRYGYLRSMQFTAVFATIGPIFAALAPNIGTMTVGRFIAGLGAGGATVVVPIYISQISPPGKKGFFGSFTQIMTNMGILITQVLGYFLSRGQLWRIILGVGGGIGLLQGISLVLGGQESPKWMADNGKPSRAKKALRKIRGHEADIDAEVAGWGSQNGRDVEDEEETLLANEDSMHTHPADNGEDNGQPGDETLARTASKAGKAIERETLGIIAVLRHPDTSPAVFAVIMVMLAQQLCGINSIVMYGVGLLSELLAANSALLNVAVSALNVILTTAAAPLVDKIGRKPCLLISISGMGTSSILIAIGIMNHISVLSAVGVILFVASFALGLGPVPFILSSELVNGEAVGATQSWALMANWIATFVVAQFFPIVNEKMGKGQVYFIFAGFALFFGIFTAWWVPETKGKATADEVWGRKKGDRED